MWWLTVAFFLCSFTCVSFLSSQPLSVLLLSRLSVSFLSLLTSSPLSLLCTLPLSSPPCLSLLPLFRLCKVQLGFGAFGLQAWRQEDALSEYALLGSLCVTLYFFALSLFTRRPYLLFSSFFSLYFYICQVTVVLSSCGFPPLMEDNPLLLITPVSCRKLVPCSRGSFSGISTKNSYSSMLRSYHIVILGTEAKGKIGHKAVAAGQ